MQKRPRPAGGLSGGRGAWMTDPLIAAAKAYAATIYRGARIDGQAAAWTTLTERS